MPIIDANKLVANFKGIIIDNNIDGNEMSDCMLHIEDVIDIIIKHAKDNPMKKCRCQKKSETITTQMDEISQTMTMPFGKHKGKPIQVMTQIDRPYVSWLINGDILDKVKYPQLYLTVKHFYDENR